MKTILQNANTFFLIMVLYIASPMSLEAQIIHFPDTNFRNALVSLGVDADDDGEINRTEAAATQALDISFGVYTTWSGLENFVNLKTLIVTNVDVDTLSLQGLINLEELDFTLSTNEYFDFADANSIRNLNLWANNNIRNIDFRLMPELRELELRYLDIDSLNFQYSPNLTNLFLANLTSLKEVQFGANDSLYSLQLGRLENLINVDFATLPKVVELTIFVSAFKSIDLAGMNALAKLYMIDNDELTNLSLIELPNLNIVDLIETDSLRSVEIINLPTLAEFNLSEHLALRTLTINNVPGLSTFEIENTQVLEELSLSNASNLDRLYVNSNFNLKNLDLKNLVLLKSLNISSNQKLETIDLQNTTNLDRADVNFNNNLESLSLLDCEKLTTLNIRGNDGLSSINLSGCVIENSVIDNDDLELLIVNEYTHLNSLRMQGNLQMTELDLSDIGSIADLFINRFDKLTSISVADAFELKELQCSQSPLLSNLDVQGCDSLVNITLFDANISTLNLEGLAQLEGLYVYRDAGLEFVICDEFTALTEFDYDGSSEQLSVDGAEFLAAFYCSGNENLKHLAIRNAPRLVELACGDNRLEEISLENANAIEFFFCGENEITFLPNETLLNLKSLDCSGNNLEHIDVSMNKELYALNCDDNNLITLSTKNNRPGTMNLQISGNPTLQWICTDVEDWGNVQSKIENFGYDNCEVEAFCDFGLKSEFTLIKGNVMVDLAGVNCDSPHLTTPYPYLAFDISNQLNMNTFVSNRLGNFYSLVPNGNYEIKLSEVLPTQLSMTPSLLDVDLTGLNYEADFCVSFEDDIRNVRIQIVPLDQSVPGFESTFKVIYNNYGSKAEEGTIEVRYPSRFVDYIGASEIPIQSDDGLIIWEYADLKPFEERSIEFSVELNRPTDMQNPLMGGEYLSFSGNIYPIVEDIRPKDNSTGIRELVVNSFDPNDKTCLQGNIITPEMLDDYLHYLIRFENLGTANARRVAVYDEIDTDRFDISSLEIVDASHPMEARISEGNLVEFLFEDIDLPFDDDNNDGYVLFKILPLSTLVIGDTISNFADIYFDFNFPIRTNTAESEVNYFSSVDETKLSGEGLVVFPNPVVDILQIDFIETIESLQIFNINGSLTRQIEFNGERSSVQSNIQNLPTGSYLLRIHTPSGYVDASLIKL